MQHPAAACSICGSACSPLDECIHGTATLSERESVLLLASCEVFLSSESYSLGEGGGESHSLGEGGGEGGGEGEGVSEGEGESCLSSDTFR